MNRRSAFVFVAAALLAAAVFVLRPAPEMEPLRRHDRATPAEVVVDVPVETALSVPTVTTPSVPVSAPASVPVVPVLPATGLVQGRVRIAGPAPKPKRLRMDADPACQALHPGAVYSDELVVDAELGLRWAFVYVKEGPLPATAPSAIPVLLDQVGCRYEPHVLGVQTGQQLLVRNGDPLLHSVHVLPFANPNACFGQPAFSSIQRMVFNQEEVMVRVRCDIHPWMSAWIGVVTHPWFAVTDETGRFQLPALGQGSYAIVLWHESYKDVVRGVTVNPGETTTLDFLLDVRK